VYRPVSRIEIIDSLIHIRNLYRAANRVDARALRAHERREATMRDLISNLPRTSEHPTLKALLDIAETCCLTLDGAHRLFGYDLGQILEYDIRLNGGRTHIIESYPFARDMPVDLPLRLAPREAFARDALLRNLVPEWQAGCPISTLEEEAWSKPGAFYIHVGTEDSLGSSIPPGAMALVAPIDREEELRPNPRRIYLLQFANGYRCSHCVATRGKLQLFTSGRIYLGREEFRYPGAVRIVGRVRMFAMTLPMPEYPFLAALPHRSQGAGLILPWEQPTRDKLLATKYKRFRRAREQEEHVREVLLAELHAKLSERSERRYRGHTSSEPHVNALLHLTVAHTTRYTDSLRAGGALHSDRGRFSLETLLNAARIDDLLVDSCAAGSPTPREAWTALREEFVEWPALLSMKFPYLKRWDERVIRLAEGSSIGGINPPIRPGSWLLLDEASPILDAQVNTKKSGWSRSLYLLRRGMESISGYLEREGTRYALLSDPSKETAKVIFGSDELSSLSRVVGIAVPI
jgi:hypothetical protein